MQVDGLLVVAESPVHRLPAHAKLVAAALAVALVVLTPAGSWAAYGAYLAIVLGGAAAARVPLPLVVRRAVVELPFAALAVALPFVAGGPRVSVGPLTLSEPGLLRGGTLLATSTTGVLVAVVLAATTGVRPLLAGLERLRLPATLLLVLSFMARYVAVVADDLRRARIARECRAAGAQVRLASVAGGVGATFVRTFERGERVQQAMHARGWTGQLPETGAQGTATVGQWATAALLPVATGAVLVATRLAGAGAGA